FYTFSQKLKDSKAEPEQEWRKIKQAFLMLQEWFEDRTLYHLVGFLVVGGMEINAIRTLAAQTTKTEFLRRLRGEIFTRVIGGKLSEVADTKTIRDGVAERLSDLEYGPNSEEIRSLLLLFNVTTLLENDRSNLRFQFDSFKNERWDIEHVRSVTSDKPERH